MLHILLTILKIIGIILLVCLGILVTVLLLVLFVPIRYRAVGHKKESELAGKARVSWLFGIVAFVAIYQEKKVDLQLKLFGINLLKLLEKEKIFASKNKNADKLEKKEDTKGNKEVSVRQPEPVVSAGTPIHSEAPEHLPEKNESRIKTIFSKIKAVPAKIIERIRKIKLTIGNICDKIKYWEELLSEERAKAAILLVKKHLVKLLKHIMPKKVKGQIIYGFEDPCTTGQVLAGVSMLYPVYYKHLNISPDFSGAVLTGNVDLRGRIYVAYLVKSAIVIFFDKNIQYIIHSSGIRRSHNGK